MTSHRELLGTRGLFFMRKMSDPKAVEPLEICFEGEELLKVSLEAAEPLSLSLDGGEPFSIGITMEPGGWFVGGWFTGDGFL